MEDLRTYQYSLVQRLSFLRYGGTDDEVCAAKILMDEITSFGGNGEYMEFTIPACECSKCSIVNTATGREIESVPYWCSGSLPEGGVDLKLVYVERGMEADYVGVGDLSGCVVMVDEPSLDAYKLMCEKKPAAFIVIAAAKYYDTADTADLVPRALREAFLKHGCVPGFSIRPCDAMELVRQGDVTLHMELIQENCERTSRNVQAVIPGTEYSEGSVVLTAHYDSVLVGTGSWDNATGSAVLMYLYQHFLKNPAKRTLRFIWCGSEEQGLLGSKAYVEKNPELVKDIKFCFNFDMNGTILGPNQIFVTGGDDLKHMAEQICCEEGYSAAIKVLVHSSDSAPFADKGIPSIGLSRGTKTAEIHTRHDLMPPLSAERMYDLGVFAAKFISRVANSAIIPVPLGMPEEMKKELDKYFKRENDAEEKKAEEKAAAKA